jgi:maltose O-acetyltransferase
MRAIGRLYWLGYDTRDFLAEAVGWIPFHILRLVLWQHVLRIRIGSHTSIHRACRFYRPAGVRIGSHTIINRDVLLDGRMGLRIGDNVSISEGVAFFTLEHDPHSPDFANRGAPICIHDRVFVGARAMILSGVTVGEGAVVAAGAVVTCDVLPYTIIAGLPARPIGQRRQDLTYTFDYKKFLG